MSIWRSVFRAAQQHPAEAAGAAPKPAGNQNSEAEIVALQQQIASLQAELSECRQAEKTTTMLAAIVESCDDAIASKDLNGIVTSWNASAERIFGYRADEIIGRPVTTIIPPELHADEDEILQKIRRGERIQHFETVRLTKSGERIHVSLTISPVRDADGRIIGAAKVARDITERKRSEEALLRAEKLAATGQLASIIAHEINNPMQALANIIALLSSQDCLDDRARHLISLADAELSRMSHIARQMLSFYRQSARAVPVRVAEIMDHALQLFETRLQLKRIRLQRRYEFSGELDLYPVEVGQLFANLVGNAVEATRPGGQIQVRIRAGQDRKDSERHGVRITIADNGCGIPSQVRHHIFEPFFTTKAERGTGLGLWVVKGIVAKHGGNIHAKSSTAPGRAGTVFSVFLPEVALEISSAQPAGWSEPAA